MYKRQATQLLAELSFTAKKCPVGGQDTVTEESGSLYQAAALGLLRSRVSAGLRLGHNFVGVLSAPGEPPWFSFSAMRLPWSNKGAYSGGLIVAPQGPGVGNILCRLMISKLIGAPEEPLRRTDLPMLMC